MADATVSSAEGKINDRIESPTSRCHIHLLPYHSPTPTWAKGYYGISKSKWPMHSLIYKSNLSAWTLAEAASLRLAVSVTLARHESKFVS